MKADAGLRANLTPKPGSLLLVLSSWLISKRTMTLWLPEEPPAWERSWVGGATWPVQSAQDGEPGLWF